MDHETAAVVHFNLRQFFSFKNPIFTGIMCLSIGFLIGIYSAFFICDREIRKIQDQMLQNGWAPSPLDPKHF